MNEYAYEFSALALLLTLEFIFLEYRRLKTVQTKYFMVFMQISIVADIVNIGYSHIVASRYSSNTFIVQVWMLLYFVLTSSVFPMFGLYLYEVVQGERWRFNRIKKIALYLPVIALLFGGIINFFTHFAYKIEQGKIVETWWMGYAYYLPVFYIALIFIIGMSCFKKFKKHEFRIFLIYVLSSSIVCTISYIYGGSMLCGVSSGLTAMVAFIYIENPVFYTDKDTKQYNKRGFELFVRDQFLHKRQFHCVVLSLVDFKTLNMITTEDNAKEILLEFAKWCEKISPDATVFHFSPSVFVLALNDEILADGIYEKIKQNLCYDNEQHIMNRLEGNLFLMQNGLECKSTKDLCKKIELISEYEDPAGKKHYFRNQDIVHYLEREIAVEEAVKKAINEETFIMYFQPVYDVKKKCFDKAEALIRLKDDKLGFIAPDEFISLAEQRGYIRKITRQVIRKTLHEIRDKNFEQLGVDSININLSTRDLWEGDLKQYLTTIMEKEQIPTSMVTLEITETATSSNEIASDFMNHMVSMGYRFAVDDYGTGYSNIERTISLPFDSIKIDKSLFYLAFEREKVGYLLKHTIGIFHDMGFSVVVEGAETEEQIEFLNELDVDYIQGFYYSKPLPVGDYVVFLKEHNQVS